MRSTRRALKRIFRGTLIRSTRSFAEAFQLAVLGVGEYWPLGFDVEDPTNLTKDFFSTKGAIATAGLNSVLAFGTGADGAAVFNRDGETESQFGSGSLASSLSITNLLPADVRDVEGGTTAGFTLIPTGTGSIALNTANFLQGAQSLEVNVVNANDGVDTDSIAVSGNAAHVAVVYIKPTTDPTSDIISISFEDDVGLIAGININAFDATGQWVKVELAGTTAVGATTARLRIQGSAATTFFCDAFQIATGDIDKAVWVDGVQAASRLSYSPAFLTAQDVTVNIWARADAATAGGDRRLVLMSKDPATNQGICIDKEASTTRVRFVTEDEGGGTDAIQSAANLWDGTWHMISVVMRRKPGVGENKKTLYVDGVSVATSDPAKLPDVSLFADIDVGHSDGTESFWRDHRGLLDELLILPYAAHPDQIAGWFTLGESIGELPELKLSGDFVGDLQLIAEGDAMESPYEAFTDRDGVHHNAGQEVNFTLDEV